LEADHDRDRQRQKLHDDVRKEDGGALHKAVGVSA
jgi:hypothetical protein